MPITIGVNVSVRNGRACTSGFIQRSSVWFCIVAGLLLACVQPAFAQPSFERKPELQANPNPRAPLAAVLTFKASGPVTTAVNIDDGATQRIVHFSQFHDPEKGLAIIDLPADRSVLVTVEISDRSGTTRAPEVLSLKTPALPKAGLEWPTLTTKIADGSVLEPGLRFLSIRRRAPGRQSFQTKSQQEFSRGWGLILALDSKGDVRWYYISERRVAGIKPSPDGTLIFTTEDQRVVKIDMLGNILRQWYPEKRRLGAVPGGTKIIGLQTLHHEPSLTPWGTYISMSANGREIPHYPTSVTDPQAPRMPAMVMGDKIVEFDAAGSVIWEWDAFDHLDPKMLHYHTFQPYWAVRGYPGYADWTHGNGITFDEKRNLVIASFKHLDALVAIDRKTKEIRWIFSDPRGWPEKFHSLILKPVGLTRFPWSQHHPHVTPKGTIVYFDNGMFQARPFDGRPIVPFHESYSRAVEVKVDPKAMTVTELWTSEKEQKSDSCINWAMGDAHRLPATDNMLVIRSFCPPITDQLNDQNEYDLTRRFVDDVPYAGRVEEFSRTSPAIRMSQIRFDDPNEILQWQLYGGFHTPSIYWEGKAGSAN
jgi:arylsulfate sulfotransferase